MIDIDEFLESFGEEEWSEEQEAAFEAESDAAWERINAMSHEEVLAYLYAHGHTQESLDAAFERCKDTIRKAGGKVE